MSSSSEDEMDMTPVINQEEEPASETYLPEKSKEKYLKAYETFIVWKTKNSVESLTEDVFLTYFNELSEKLKPSTLWGIYSMLKSTIITKHDVNIQYYKKLISLLKKKARGYKSKKSKVFTPDEVAKFLKEAPDEVYLATKVAMIFGISGACTGVELANITVQDVIGTQNNLLLIKFPTEKGKADRTFVIPEEFTHIVQKYRSMRPSNVETNRFFLNYQLGKCTKQVIGKNKFVSFPKKIATYLNLPNPDLYTGRCFRTTSASLLHSGENSNRCRKNRRLPGSITSTDQPYQKFEVYIEEELEKECKQEPVSENSPDDNSSCPSASRDDVTGLNWQSSIEEDTLKNPQLSPSHEQEDTTERKKHEMLFSELNQTNFNIPGKTVQTNINMPGKTISLNFTNCSNVTFNF